MSLTKDEWIIRCADRLALVIDWMTLSQREELAEICLDACDNDLSESPEDAADEELSCWQD